MAGSAFPIARAGVLLARVTQLEGLRAREICQQYQRRRDVLIRGLRAAGWPVETPKASMYVWAAISERCRTMGSLEFAKKLLAEAKVAVSPGVGFGAYGEGFLRFAGSVE